MLSIAYLGLIVFIAIFELIRKKENIFDFLSLFHLFFILLYALPGCFITNLNIKERQAFDPAMLGLSDRIIQHTWQVPLAIFLTYFLVIIGYYSASAPRLANAVNIKSRTDDTIWRIVIVILTLSWFSIFIYSSQYGGIVQAIADANFIRSGAVEGQALGFFVRLLYFNFFAAYLIASFLFIRKGQKKKLWLWVLFILAFAGSLIAAFMVSARATMILALINFYLAYLLCKRKLNLPILIPILVAISLFIVYGKILFYSLSGISKGGYIEVIDRFQEAASIIDNRQGFFLSLIKVFSYGFVSIYAAFNEHYQIRLLGDWVSGFGSYLPDRLIRVEIAENVSVNNSLFLIGHNEYTIPTGFVAACVYSWSWIGIIIYSFVYGWLGRFLSTFLMRHLQDIFWVPFVYVTSAQAWSDFLAAGDPQIFLQTNFWILTSLFFLLVFGVKVSFRDSK